MIEIDKLVRLHINESKSLRQICRELRIPEGNKSYLGTQLRKAGYEVRKGKSGFRVGDTIMVICPECNKERQIVSRGIKPYNRLCNSCATAKSHKNNPRIGRGENHYNWQGGINLNAQGYILEYVKKDNPLFPMAANTHRAGGYILQHRLVMAKHLGRLLQPFEIVHHINGDKTDNRLENLHLTCRIEHTVTYQDGFRYGFAEAMRLNNKVWNGKDWKFAEPQSAAR